VTLASWWRPLALVVAGVVGAVALPLWWPGIGWPIAALAITGAALALRRVDGAGTRAPSVADRIWRLGSLVGAVALVAVAAVRAAEWLVALCLLVAVPLAAVGVAGGPGWLGLARGVAALPRASALTLVSAVRDAVGRGNANRAAPGDLVRAAVGLAVGGLLVCVFGALFWAADATFAGLLRGWFTDISVPGVTRAVLGFVLVVGLAAGLARAVPPPSSTQDGRPTRLGVPEWAIAIAMLDVLFGVFVWVQVTVLFGGNRYVLGPGGPDYAVYARGGFAQLLWVTVLTLAVLAVLTLWARRDTRAQRVLLRVLAGTLCVLSLVIVTSALKRMGLYVQAYGFTVPRLLGYAVVCFLGIVFALVIVAGVRLRAPWLPRATVAAGVGLLLALAVLNPEALMARTLLARLDGPYPIDRAYVASLSADAIDVIDRMVPEPERSCVLARLERDLERPEPWYGRNLARERARELLARKPIRLVTVCLLVDDLPVAG